MIQVFMFSLCPLILIPKVTRFSLYVVNSYPETRHRYWNGYMLFYEAIDTNKVHNNLLNCGRGPLIRQEAIIEGRLVNK